MKRVCFAEIAAGKKFVIFLLAVALLCTTMIGPFSHVIAVTASSNLLTGKQPVQFYVSGGGYNLGTSATGGKYYGGGAAQNPTATLYEKLTNGVKDTAKENCLYFTDEYYTSKRALVLIYDLGDTYDLASMRLVSDTGNDRVGVVRFYAGTTIDDRAALFAAANRVDTFADAQVSEAGVAAQTLSGVSARYVAFVIMKGLADGVTRNDQTFIRELEVCAEKKDAGDQNEAINLLTGKQPVQFYVSGGGYNLGTSATDGKYYSGGAAQNPTATLYEKLTNGVEDTAKENCLYFTDEYYTSKRALVLIYDLGDTYDLASMRLVSDTGNDRVGVVRFYAGTTIDDRAALFAAANRVDTFADAQVSETGVAAQTLSGVSARYVAFVIMKGLADGVTRNDQTFIRELEVCAEKKDAVTDVPVSLSVVDQNGFDAADACTTTLPNSVESGKDLSFTITPGATCEIVEVKANDTVLSPTNSGYLVTNVTAPVTVTVTVNRISNLIKNQLPLDFYTVSRSDYAIKVNTILKVNDITFDTMETATTDLRSSLLKLTDGITDGSIENRSMLYAYDKNVTMAEKPVMVLVYDLGGVADVNKLHFVSSGEAGYYVAGYDYFISTTLEGLLNENNLVYSSKGNQVGADGELDPATDITEREKMVTVSARGRYAAVVITRPLPPAKMAAGYKARAVEFAVYGNIDGAHPVTAATVDENGNELKDACAIELPAFVVENDNLSFSVTPQLGYRVVSVKVNDTPLTATEGVYTVANVTAPQSIVVTLRSLQTYPVTCEVVDEAGKELTDACTHTLPSVAEKDGSFFFAVSPAPGFRVLSVEANGNRLSATDGMYAVSEVRGPQNVKITLGSITNLIAGRSLFQYYAVERDDYQTPVYMISVTSGDTDLTLTDGSIADDNRFRIRTTGNDMGDKVTAESKNIVLIYYLGGIADVQNIYFASTNEKGYYVAGYDYYVGNSIKNLLSSDNMVYSSGGNQLLDDGLQLDPETSILERETNVYFEEAKRGRYVAIVITRPHSTTSVGYNMARIAEIGVHGKMVQEDELANLQFTDDKTGLTLYVSATVPEVTKINAVKMTVEQLTLSDVTKTVLNKQRMIPVSERIRIRLYDAAGKLIPSSAFEEYTCKLVMPTTDKHFQFWNSIRQDVAVLVDDSTTRDGNVIGVVDDLYSDFVTVRFLDNTGDAPIVGDTQILDQIFEKAYRQKMAK